MRNIKLTIEYDGTNYCGWQVQPNGTTVQAVLQDAISKMTGRRTLLQGASRTDAGVHALGQVANFRTVSKIACRNFIMGLNSLLPDDIVVKDAEEVDDGFHAKRSSKGKHYRYLIMTGECRPALLRHRVWFIKGAGKKALHDMAMDINRSAQVLLGEHDFSAFCGAGDANRSKVRRIEKIEVRDQRSEVGDRSSDIGHPTSNIIAIDIVGNGFLKYMVRNIVGTLVKSRSAREIKGILDSGDRKKAGVTAPAFGLYLVEVLY